MFRRSAVFVLSLLIATASNAQIVGGTISGTVLDPAGAVVPGAGVTIRNQETGGERHLITDAGGAYAAPSIPVGIYNISVARDGSSPQSRTSISITIGEAMHIDLTLQPGGVTEQVTVTDAPSPINILPEPRVGIAWDVFGNGKTSRSGIGLHHSLLDNLDYRLDQAAPYNTTLSYANVPIANPVNGVPGLISPSNVQTDIATPAVISYAFSIEQQLDRATSITIGYVGSHGYQQILSEDQNEPASIICSTASTCPAGAPIGTIYYPTIVKANPLVANTTSWISGGFSNYNALELDLRHNFVHGFQFRANYTYAKNLDNGSAWNTSVSANTPAFVSYPANPSLDYGPAATDVRHLASFNATYELPMGHGQTFLSSASPRVSNAVSGWSLSTIATLQTGFPFSPQLGWVGTGVLLAEVGKQELVMACPFGAIDAVPGCWHKLAVLLVERGIFENEQDVGINPELKITDW